MDKLNVLGYAVIKFYQMCTKSYEIKNSKKINQCLPMMTWISRNLVATSAENNTTKFIWWPDSKIFGLLLMFCHFWFWATFDKSFFLFWVTFDFGLLFILGNTLEYTVIHWNRLEWIHYCTDIRWWKLCSLMMLDNWYGQKQPVTKAYLGLAGPVNNHITLICVHLGL